jgi:hypothetical protein
MKLTPPLRAAWTGFKAVVTGMRKLAIAVIGGTVLLIGIALIVLPGPAFIVIPVGLAILATEFAWARRAVVKARAVVTKARGRQPEAAVR